MKTTNTCFNFIRELFGVLLEKVNETKLFSKGEMITKKTLSGTKEVQSVGVIT